VCISSSDAVYQPDIFFDVALEQTRFRQYVHLKSVVNRVLSIDFEGMLNLFSKILSIVFSM